MDRLLGFLNDFTKEVLEDVAGVELPDGFEITVSADSDVVLAHPSGHWIGLRRRGRSYEAWRGSIYRFPVRFPSLEDAVRYYCRRRTQRTVPDPD